jgi:peptidoglycan/LPS O-acetylase OafA/YrhL
VQSQNIAYSERLDHLRFFAALSVISFHSFHPIYVGLSKAASSAAAAVNPLNIFFVEGFSAVGLFLTLTGFLFARICLSGNVDFKQFYINRALRIYPLYLSALVFSMCVVPAPFTSFLTSLFSFQTLREALHSNYVDHLWSVGVEIQFYVIFPLLLIGYRKFGMKYLAQVVALCVLLLCAIHMSTGGTRDVAYATILGRLNQGVIGMMLGFSFDRFRKYLKNPIALIAAISALSAALLWFHGCGGMNATGGDRLWVYWLTLEAMLWGAVICCYHECAVNIPRAISKGLAALGSMSFSIYVMHYFVACSMNPWFVNLMVTPHHRYKFLLPLQDFLMRHPTETALLAGTFLILPPTLLLAFFSFNVIERPFMTLRKRYVTPGGAPLPVPYQESVDAKELTAIR